METSILDHVAVLQEPLAAPALPDVATPAGLRRETFQAMGTTISLLLPESRARSGAQIVRRVFGEWEQALSRFLPDSEVSWLNQRAGTPTVVSGLLYHVLMTALAAAQATRGVYDPTLSEPPGGGWRGIQVDRVRQRVTIPAGVKLDFGGIAKGMAVDAALEQLLLRGLSPALVNAGGDLAVQGVPPGARDWPLSVPGRERAWTIPLHRGAVVTSGVAHRHWRQGEKLRHHLLDPRTGESAASDLWSVTVVADRCEQAEVAAKVACILGSRQGADFLRTHRIAGLLVREDGGWETVQPWPVDLMKEEA